MFNRLYSDNVSQAEKLHILNDLLQEAQKRASYGNFNQTKFQYLLGLIYAIIEALNSSDATVSQLEAFYRKLEITYKKFLYIFVLTGEENYLYGMVKNHLLRQEYMIAEQRVEGFPYFVELNFDKGLECSSDVFPVTGYVDSVYMENIHYRINKTRYNEQTDKKVRGVVTGLSYTYYAIKTDLMTDEVAMLATPSQDLFYDFEMLKKCYADHGDTLAYVIAGLCPYTLRFDLSQAKGSRERTIEYYRDYKTLHNYKPDISEKLDSIEKAIYDIWGYDFIDEVYYHYIYPLHTMETAISTAQWTFDEKCIDEQTTNDMYAKTHKEYPETLKENKEILSQYMQFCKNHNLKLFFVMPPFTNYYKANWNNDYVDELWAAINELGADVDYTILDFTDETWEDYYFGDYAHLNDIGAIRFTPMLDRVIHANI